MEGWTDFEKGVQVKAGWGDQINISYNGLLAKSGAQEIYLHYGYSDPESWQESETMRMEHTSRGFEKSIPMKNHIMAFCFKDNAQNWDNNNGFNWIVRR